MAAASKARKAHDALRREALAYPEAVEDAPWGDPVYKVRKKIFLFLSFDRDGLSITVKLPDTAGIALMLPNVEPTGYGLGRSGWVSATFPPAREPPMKMLRAWVDESYRSVAPRRLVARLDAAAVGPEGRR